MSDGRSAEVGQDREYPPVVIPTDREAELAEDGTNVRFHSSLCQPEPLRNRRVCSPLGHQGEYLALARRQLDEGILVRRRRDEHGDDLRIERRSPFGDTPSGVEEVVDVENTVLEQITEAASCGDKLEGVAGLDVLRENQDGGLRVRSPDLGRRVHALVLVLGRHPYVDDGKIRLVLSDDGHQGLGIAHPCDDLMSGILKQSCEPLTKQDGVLGDHDPHGISTSIRVPAPRGLWMRNVPPLPSSATTSFNSPFATDASTRTRDGDPCLTAFVTASQTTK